ncbi:hypothetical protein, partial [Vibrio parahaemolyticus]|uniref:hypothetical protein n=1 Tax=Vibrio parahaemolyticus TaxID=670 RepID=UPI001C305727
MIKNKLSKTKINNQIQICFSLKTQHDMLQKSLTITPNGNYPTWTTAKSVVGIETPQLQRRDNASFTLVFYCVIQCAQIMVDWMR